MRRNIDEDSVCFKYDEDASFQAPTGPILTLFRSFQFLRCNSVSAPAV